jgi:ATP-dependent RNA helicase SUPV3L1/SUV3
MSTSQLTLALGPTNTGKTHRAIERMLEHDTGMLGLPLRLLAREVYDKVSAQIGERRVALVTGEEKRIPERPSYWICTVEAMPRQVEVDFLAVDEIQLIAHPTRGHLFSDRLLHSRGRLETWFLGSHTARDLVQQLVPGAVASHRPRLSRLSHTGAVSLGGLPPKSAVVAFNTAHVYELAERIRARRGGAAVVLGALSPRTRNAQVAMFQSGEVDHLVATDAIGMGLNLSLNHVAFSALHKYDGKESRPLLTAELAQIAGRAGRYSSDGTFGTLTPCPPLSQKIAHQIETHSFPRDRYAEWRNSDLVFDSVETLLGSLAERPKHPLLRPTALADDTLALNNLLQRASVRHELGSAREVELLWQVCQIPDYRKLLPEAHAELLHSVFQQLVASSHALSEDWLRERLQRLDDVNGDLDSLLGRISFVRTWTYVCNQPGWVTQAATWQALAREIEDRLSDALHDRLVQRFVERTRKHSFAAYARPARKVVSAELVEPNRDSPFATLIRLMPRLRGAAPSADEHVHELDALADAPHDAFVIDRLGRIQRGDDPGATEPLARLRRGQSMLRPELRLDPVASGATRLRLERRLRAFVRDWVEALVASLAPLTEDSEPVRGLLYQLRSGLGTLETRQAQSVVERLSGVERMRLRERGITLGKRFVYAQALLQPGALIARSALAATYFELKPETLPEPGSERSARASGAPLQALLAAGYTCDGSSWVRCDLVHPGVSGEISRRTRRRRHRKPRVSAE